MKIYAEMTAREKRISDLMHQKYLDEMKAISEDRMATYDRLDKSTRDEWKCRS